MWRYFEPPPEAPPAPPLPVPVDAPEPVELPEPELPLDVSLGLVPEPVEPLAPGMLEELLPEPEVP